MLMYFSSGTLQGSGEVFNALDWQNAKFVWNLSFKELSNYLLLYSADRQRDRQTKGQTDRGTDSENIINIIKDTLNHGKQVYDHSLYMDNSLFIIIYL